jgi:hypothetical protein
MPHVSQTTFWSVISIMASAVGGILILTATHANEPKHSDSAGEKDLSNLEVRVEGVATRVENNRQILDEVKDDIKELREEQRNYSDQILRAIRSRQD